MKLIIGLGNIGDKYENTRHNIGFKVMDKLSDTFKHFHHLALISKDHDIIYAKPITFMNNSGEAVFKLMDYYKIKKEDILIVHDDCYLDLGNIRLKTRGSSAGHNGIKSIVHYLGVQEFSRLKLGVGQTNPEHLSHFVLSKFKKTEQDEVEYMVIRAVDAVKMWINNGNHKVMQTFNKKNV